MDIIAAYFVIGIVLAAIVYAITRNEPLTWIVAVGWAALLIIAIMSVGLWLVSGLIHRLAKVVAK